MSEKAIARVLTSSVLTEKEAEVYIFLAKHDAKKATDIAKLLGKDKSQVFHILKSLQTKGFVEATVEFPTHFAAVPFENVIRTIIETKQKEVAGIKRSEKKLIAYLRQKQKVESEPSIEKFMVIKGDKEIYSKISKMILDTEHELSAATTVSGLLSADRFGIFDEAFNHSLRPQISFRFLTELSEQNLKTAINILKRMPTANFNLKARNPDLGLSLFPRMVTRDGREVLFFITPRTSSTTRDDVCIWTNTKSLVQAFTVVFDGLWANSTGMTEKIMEIETGKPTPTASVINDAYTALETYDEVMRSAEEEIMIMTSSEGLVESLKHVDLLEELARAGVSIKIMAPITYENLQVANELSKYAAVRHVPASISDIIVADGKRLIQSQAFTSQKPILMPHFYTDNLEYVEKAKNMLNTMWRNAQVPSPVTLNSIINPLVAVVAPIPEEEHAWSRPDGPYQKMVHGVKERAGAITEKDVLNEIVNAKKYPAKNWPQDIIRLYGSAGQAVIHPPAIFNLPDMLIWAVHENKQSSFGVTDRLFVYLWLETPKGFSYVPVASVTDNPSNVEFEKIRFANTPAGQNVQLLKKDDLQVRIHGNAAFAGWTKPIPLIPSKYTLPPSCILLEGYSGLKTGVLDYELPSGVKTTSEYNGFDAFVTFFHPASKYSGPGTDGTIGRDIVVTIRSP